MGTRPSTRSDGGHAWRDLRECKPYISSRHFARNLTDQQKSNKTLLDRELNI